MGRRRGVVAERKKDIHIYIYIEREREKGKQREGVVPWMAAAMMAAKSCSGEKMPMTPDSTSNACMDCTARKKERERGQENTYISLACTEVILGTQ